MPPSHNGEQLLGVFLTLPPGSAKEKMCQLLLKLIFSTPPFPTEEEALRIMPLVEIVLADSVGGLCVFEYMEENRGRENDDGVGRM